MSTVQLTEGSPAAVKMEPGCELLSSDPQTEATKTTSDTVKKEPTEEHKLTNDDKKSTDTTESDRVTFSQMTDDCDEMLLFLAVAL